MELKWIVLAALVLIMVYQVEADFYFNHIWPKEDELEENDLKCVPGRTIIKLIEKPAEPVEVNSSDDEDEDFGNALRSHMNTKIKEDYCKVCVCSVEGKDEYCSGRPAMNVNECLRMSTLMEQFHNNVPFDHKRTLAYRIRRVGSDSNYDESTSCVPFISEYTDCTSENRCKGCVKCLCLADATWSCTDVQECPEKESEYQLEDSSIDDVLNEIQYRMSNNYNPNNMYNPGAAKGNSKTSFVPRPPEKDSDLLLGYIIAVPK